MSNTLHVAIIPDGNRRWARQHGINGYKKLYDIAIDRLVDVTSRAFEDGVTHLSLWGSSHANLSNRSTDFFHGIDMAFRTNMHKFSDHPTLEKYDVRINIIGEWRNSLSAETIEVFNKALEKTSHRRAHELTLLIDYSGTRERAAAVESIMSEPKSIVSSELLLQSRSWTGHLPDLDLIIRTGSWDDPHNSAGFMSLLADESQLAFPAVFWPDFTPTHFHEILTDFKRRERRRGK